jgi:D-3-phosphoglycerate dehydrogenase
LKQDGYLVAVGPSSFAQQDDAPLRLLENAGVEVRPNPFGRRLTEKEILRQLEDVDGLIAGLEPLNRRVLNSSPQLKVIARVGIGMDNVDQEAAAELGIKVSNTPEGPTAAVAELTVAALLALCRGLVSANDALHSGKWDKRIGMGLSGLNVLLVGYGRIGRRVSELLRPFGTEIAVCDPYIDPDQLPDYVRPVTLTEGLAEAEVISLHASGKETLLGPAEFDQMKDGVVILNSARGALIEESALVNALDSGRVRSAWLDVFWDEPYTGPLTRYKQVLLTPHISTYTEQCRRQMEVAAVENLLRDLGINL